MKTQAQDTHTPHTIRPAHTTLTLLLATLLLISVGWFVQHETHPTADVADVPVPDQSLAFVPNIGQVAPAVQYEVQRPDGRFFFTDSAIAVALPSNDSSPNRVVEIAFAGADMATMAPGAAHTAVVNTFVGNDPAQWQQGVPTHDSVTYPALYPGISLEYGGHEGMLKGTFVVAPHSDPTQIRWHYTGGTPTLSDNGALVVRDPATGSELLTETAPVAWQTVNGARVPVEAAYTLHDGGGVGFALGTYDHTLPLVIDPTIVYSTYLGGTQTECNFGSCGIATDAAGNIYVAGEVNSRDFPLLNASYDYCGRAPGGDIIGCSGSSMFVSKFNADGTLAYSTYFGSSSAGEGLTDIAADADGNIYVTGSGALDPRDPMDAPFAFPVVGANAQECVLNNPGTDCVSIDAFTSWFDENGALYFSTFISGGAGREDAGQIAVDPMGNVYVTGETGSDDFPTSAEVFQPTYGGGIAFGGDVYIVKYAPDGSIIYSSYLGGSSDEDVGAIAADKDGNAYVVGVTGSNDFPIANPFCTEGCGDPYLSKISADGTQLLFSTRFQEAINTANAAAVDVDDAGNIYVGGFGIPAVDAYVLKLSNDGTQLLYETVLNGFGRVGELVVDNQNRVYATGTIDGSSGAARPFVAVLNRSGHLISSIEPDGAAATESGRDIDVDNNGGIYLIGTTSSNDFPVTDGTGGTLPAYDSTFNGESDVYVMKLTLASTVSGTATPSGTSFESPGDDAAITLNFPDGSLEAEAEVMIENVELDAGAISNDSGFEILVDLFNLEANQGGVAVDAFDDGASGYRVVITYGEDVEEALADLGLDESDLNLYFNPDSSTVGADGLLPGEEGFPSNGYQPLLPCTACSLDTDANRLSVPFNRTGSFIVGIQSPNNVYIPLVIRQ